MTGIELYINNRLCDLDNAENYAIYLKRVLINPSELSVKDAQVSYEVSLPATATNNAIFGYTNTEEVRGKFSLLYDALLYAGGVKILDGKFKISEIGKDYYKGNLGVPAQKAIKDIFGETKMNEAGKWEIEFHDQSWITKYNDGSATPDKIPPCIFPLVLYGLLPKKEIVEGSGRYTEKTMLDESVKFSRDDFPPSVNCMQMLKQIFNQKNLILSGNAFEDERLTNLYVSYKNPSDYPMRWNYGKLGIMAVSGRWTNILQDDKDPNRFYQPELNYGTIPSLSPSNRENSMYVVDLFKSTNGKHNIQTNTGKNIIADGNRITLTVPYSGLYKIRFKAKIMIERESNGLYESNRVYSNNPKIISAGKQPEDIPYIIYNSLIYNKFEIKLLRSKNEANAFSFEKVNYDNLFYKDNLNQNVDPNDRTGSIYYFPQKDQVNFIDPKQNPYMLCGFSFGRNAYYTKNPAGDVYEPRNPIAIKPGKSWENDNVFTNAVTYSPPYWQMEWKNGEYINSKITKDTFKFDLLNTSNYIKYLHHVTTTEGTQPMAGEGYIEQVVSLEKGEQLTVMTLSDEFVHYGKHTTDIHRTGWGRQYIDYELDVSLFKEDESWLKLDLEENKSTKAMNWADTSTDFTVNTLDLMRFLPSTIKINDWVDNFCKAFNLDLIQLGANEIELNTKRNQIVRSEYTIDLDSKANVNLERTNNTLGLPSVYELSFSIDKNEEGYVRTLDANGENGDDGGVRFLTGSPENKLISQSSNFSYNWFKQITDTKTNKQCLFPVITDKDIWLRSKIDYAEMMGKYYGDKSQRFWYRATGENKFYDSSIDNGIAIKAALVSNQYQGQASLNLTYKNIGNSITSSYFTLLANSNNCYTIVKCYLTPDEYNNINNCRVLFNGDLYWVAEIDGYDPLGKKKATLKLIRKLIV